MHTNPNQRSLRWLAGWYTIPAEKGTFLSRYHEPSPWGEASRWLHEEMHRQAAQWEASECFSLHVGTGQVLGNIPFENCLHFIEWALATRQDRGVWGRDAQRCYYLIVADGGESGDRAPVSADVTPPLPLPNTAPTGTFTAEDLAHLGPGLVYNEHTGEINVQLSPDPGSALAVNSDH